MIYDDNQLPGARLDYARMPAHWLLARLGKTVLRPGGLQLTRRLLEQLAITHDDDVVEFAPGLGTTANSILAGELASYIGIERDANAASWAERNLSSHVKAVVRVGRADRSGLANGSASVVIGEAMLSMNSHQNKARIVAEAARLLRPGGRYGIHELSISSDDLSPITRTKITDDLTSTLHVAAAPLSLPEWEALLSEHGFVVIERATAPMHLLRPSRLIEDEGVFGALRIASNLLKSGKARKRVLSIRAMFERYRKHLMAVAIVAEKRSDRRD